MMTGNNTGPTRVSKDTRYSSKIFVSKQIELKINKLNKVSLVELEFRNLDTSKDSFEARIFLNNPSANHRTKRTLEQGYAASLHVFGHGARCYGGAGHCDVKERTNMYDLRSEHPLNPNDEYVDITDTFKKVYKPDTPIKVTIVPILMSCDEMTDPVNVLKFNGISIHVHTD